MQWQRTASGKRFQGHFEPLTHPTMPDATSRPGSAAYRAAMQRLLEQWNGGLERLDAALGRERDRRRTLVSYGDELEPDDREQIPENDMPPGTPPWMRSLKQWATRKGSTAELKRATIEVRVPRRTPLAITAPPSRVRVPAVTSTVTFASANSVCLGV